MGPRMSIADAPSFLSQYHAIFRRDVLRFRACRDDPRILDLGANVGVASLYFRRLYPRARIEAFEPDPVIYELLVGNCSTADIEAETRRTAVWTANGEVSFFSEGSDAGRVATAEAAVITVPSVRFRDLLDEPVDFVKMDIEGAEAEVILDAADRLDQVAEMFIEYHSFSARAQPLSDLLSALRDAGFRVHVHAEGIASKPFIERVDVHGMDNQLDLFCYRS